jgi:integrase
MLTGQRRSEISDLEWPEIDFDEKQINLPKKRVKNNRDHVVPLSPQALAILKSIEQTSKPVFHQRDWVKPKDDLDEKIKFGDWTVHDLRRTCSTGMGDLGVQPHIIEAVLNHAVVGVAGVYNKASYLKEKRDALDQYAAWIMKAVA